MKITRFGTEVADKAREARFQALENIRSTAQKENVDFIVIAGDLFDDHAVDRKISERAFDLLRSFAVPVFVLSGNHDPLIGGSVWDRPPWSQNASPRLVLFREAKPVDVEAGVVLFPCPVFQKTSPNDPTAWFAQAPDSGAAIRIGVAHGSLKVRPDLKLDDHLIYPYAARDGRLDYLALGHWHRQQRFCDDADKVERTAYSGVHEPMQFRGGTENLTGWFPYSGVNQAEFLNGDKGSILHVRIDGKGAPPVIRSIEVGHLIWEEEKRALTNGEDLKRLIDEIALRQPTERRLLRLQLEGVLDAEAMLRLDHLREVLGRYVLGDLNTEKLHLKYTEYQMREVAGQGVLATVLERLREEEGAADPNVRQTAAEAVLLLYRIAREVAG
jgi:DNA repair exonuclease SbcCD nuclease subunit